MSAAAIQTSLDPGQCPLCQQPNDCQLCTTAAYKGQCWCERVNVPDELLIQVPHDFRNKACICRACISAFHRKHLTTAMQGVRPGDFYFDSGGLMVFTEAYHLRRGYCCGSDCRHCPYKVISGKTAPLSL